MRQRQVAGERVRALTGVLVFGLAWFASFGATVQTAAAQNTRRAPVSADSVRHVADMYFRALADERWDAAAALVDTTVIARIVSEQLRRPARMPQREMTVDDFMRDDPDKPRVVAEYEFKRWRETLSQLERSGAGLSFLFAGVRSIADLRALTMHQATVAFIKAQDYRVMYREQVRLSGCGDSTTAMIPYSIRRIVATAVASDTAAYVLYQDPMFDFAPSPGHLIEPRIMMLRVRDAAWKIVPGWSINQGTGVGGVDCLPAKRR